MSALAVFGIELFELLKVSIDNIITFIVKLSDLNLILCYSKQDFNAYWISFWIDVCIVKKGIVLSLYVWSLKKLM